MWRDDCCKYCSSNWSQYSSAIQIWNGSVSLVFPQIQPGRDLTGDLMEVGEGRGRDLWYLIFEEQEYTQHILKGIIICVTWVVYATKNRMPPIFGSFRKCTELRKGSVISSLVFLVVICCWWSVWSWKQFLILFSVKIYYLSRWYGMERADKLLNFYN